MAGLPSNQGEDDATARILARMQTILQGSRPPVLPLSTERDAMSPMAQRQETLQQGDLNELSLPPPQEQRHPIGATIGGLAGMAIGAPVGPLPAAAMSSVLSGGGEAVQQLVEHAVGSKHAPSSTGEAAKRVAGEMALGGLSELGGRYASKAIQSLRRPATATAEEALQFVEKGMPFNGKQMIPPGSKYQDMFLTPAEQTGGKNYIQTLQNVAEGSFGGKGMIEEFKTGRDKFLQDTMGKFTQQLGDSLPPDKLGELVAQDIRTGYEAARAPARSVYNFLTTTTMPKQKPVYSLQDSGILNKDGSPHMVKVQTGTTMDTKTGAWANIASIKQSLNTDAQVAGILKGLGSKEGGDDIVASIQALPDKVPYFVAQKLRSRLQSMADVFSIENKKAPALGILKNTAGQMDQAIEQGLKDYHPDAADLWRYANQTYKGANEDFNNEFLRSMLKTIERKKGGMPEEVINALVTPQKFSDLQRVKKAVDPDTWSSIQRSVVQREFSLATNDGVLNPHKLEQALFGQKGFGQEKMDVLFSKDQQYWMKQFIGATHQTTTSADTTGKMAIQLQQTGAAMKALQAGAAVGLAAHVHPTLDVGAGAILLAPPLLAKIMTTPSTAKMFVKAMNTPAASGKAGAVVGRLLNVLVPRASESDQTSRGVERQLPSTQDGYGGLNLP